MAEIKCPNCGEVFQVDESGYAEILRQVRTDEFNKELSERLELLQNEKAAAVNQAKTDAKLTYAEQSAQKEKEIAELKAKLQNAENEKRLAVSDAVKVKEEELFRQREDIVNLKAQYSSLDDQWQKKELVLKEKYEAELRLKQEQIDYYKDFKARQSTKMVGESLEVHCETEFNKLRATAFPRAYFEKDNDARTGSKGDYIYRELDENGVEIISIMFEMKNEMDTTATKHKNADFFKELDKDRREKNCEYAVLVTMLEGDSELYNTGIVDVSYQYEKMYVIRPQFFIPMITVLRNAALNSLSYKQELQVVRNQNIDITHFEENIEAFKTGFARNYELASRQFKSAIEEIDKSIDHLNKIKDYLTKSENNLRLANNKADDLSIKKLTKNNPTMTKRFEELKNSDEQ